MNLVNWRTVAAQEGWRWLQARGIEVHVFHSTSIAVS
jgi:hypothetical protein